MVKLRDVTSSHAHPLPFLRLLSKAASSGFLLHLLAIISRASVQCCIGLANDSLSAKARERLEQVGQYSASAAGSGENAEPQDRWEP